jgi:diguanylate cyclase (GGDEF)-like protein
MSNNASDVNCAGSRQSGVLAEMMRRESPKVFVLFSIFILAHLLQHEVTGEHMDLNFLVSDLSQIIVFLTISLLVWSQRLPAPLLPWVIQSGVVLGVAGQTYDFLDSGESWPIFLMLALAGGLSLYWAPFIIGSALSTAIAGTALLMHESEHAASWVIAICVAVAAHTGTVQSRRRHALDLGQAHCEVELSATNDHLTGLLNRRGLIEQAHFISGLAHRTGEAVFVVFIDVGGLKRVNDAYGHGAGDRLLGAVAGALRVVARESDLACRWGGDEFVMVGLGLRPDPEALSARLLAAMDMTGLEHRWEPRLWVGSAQGSSADDDLNDIIHWADQDLYRNRMAAPQGSTR